MSSAPGGGPAGAAVRRWVVDRRSGDWVVVQQDDGVVLELPDWLLPAHLSDGDVLIVRSIARAGGTRTLQITYDAAATAARRQAAADLLARLRSRDGGAA